MSLRAWKGPEKDYKKCCGISHTLGDAKKAHRLRNIAISKIPAHKHEISNFGAEICFQSSGKKVDAFGTKLIELRVLFSLAGAAECQMVGRGYCNALTIWPTPKLRDPSEKLLVHNSNNEIRAGRPSPVSNPNPTNKRLHAFKTPNQLSCLLKLKTKKSAALSLTIVNEMVSLTCSMRVVGAHSISRSHSHPIPFKYTFSPAH